MKTLIEFQETDTELLCAAALHDVIEDTAQGKEEIDKIASKIRNDFSEQVLNLVLEVSDDKSLPYQERKRLQIKNTPSLSNDAKKIKIADKICNIKDMVSDPPTSWETERKVKYLEWAKNVIDGARGVNSSLEEYFDSTIKEASHKLINK
jgi:guanosine-3',5'-bis(diphosphate) 3'-pyrophosphohydrolase